VRSSQERSSGSPSYGCAGGGIAWTYRVMPAP
jgi:hypothetical protein